MVCLQRVSLNPVRRSRHRLYLALTRSRAAGSCFGPVVAVSEFLSERQLPASQITGGTGSYVGANGRIEHTGLFGDACRGSAVGIVVEAMRPGCGVDSSA
jgi:hypothetical protein